MNFLRFFNRYIINSVVLFFCLPVLSEKVGIDNTTENLVENIENSVLVVTAQRRSVDINDILSNAEFLSRQELELINHTHINEALSRVSGVWISRGNGQEHLTAIRSPVFTGPGSCGEFLLLEDGVSLRASGFCNVNQLFDANSEQAARIEVVKGANSALYGTNAVHGTIHLINSLPSSNENNANLSVGPHQYSRVNASLNSYFENNSAWSLNLNSTYDGGFKNDSGFSQQKFNAAHVGQWQNKTVTTRISGSLLNQETAGFLQRGENAYRQRQFQRVNEFPEAFRDAWSIRLQSRIDGEYYAENNIIEWYLTPYFRSNKMEFLMHFLPGQPIETNGHDSLGFQFGGVYIDGDSQFSWGFDAEYTDAFLTQYQRGVTNTGSAFLNEVLPQGAHYDYQINARTVGAFAQWEHQWTTGWSTRFSSRLDYQQFDYDNRLTDGRLRDDGTPCGFGGCRYTRPADTKNTFNDFSWSLASGYQLTKQWLSYVKLDRAFRAPQATELYRLQNGQSTAEIQAVDAESVEFGFRYTSNLESLDINLFQIYKDNVIFQNSDREFVSEAKTHHQGLELSLSKTFESQFYAGIAASYTRHTYENNVDLNGTGNESIDGNDIDTAPRLLGNLKVGLEYQLGKSLNANSAELEVVFIDEYYTNALNSRDYSGHTLFNIRIMHHFNNEWRGALRVINLTDKLYAERADFAFGNDRYFVGEPRSIYLELSSHWR